MARVVVAATFADLVRPRPLRRLRLPHREPGALSTWTFRVLFVVIPLAFRAVLVRGRLARASVGELIVGLEKTREPGALRDALARALTDPSLTAAYWLPDEARYVDLDG